MNFRSIDEATFRIGMLIPGDFALCVRRDIFKSLGSLGVCEFSL